MFREYASRVAVLVAWCVRLTLRSLLPQTSVYEVIVVIRRCVYFIMRLFGAQLGACIVKYRLHREGASIIWASSTTKLESNITVVTCCIRFGRP